MTDYCSLIIEGAE